MKVCFFILFLFLANVCLMNAQDKPLATVTPEVKPFNFVVDQFADARILKFQLVGFENLSLNQKNLVYYLYQACLSGRDIIWDQNYKYNLTVRKTLENIVENYQGDRKTEDWNQFMVYVKRVWFSNGIHHHYSTDKILPAFSKEYFETLVKNSTGEFPLKKEQTIDNFIQWISVIVFDTTIDYKRVCLDSSKDLIQNSANNFYENVTQKEAEGFYAKMTNKEDQTPIWYGLNSKLIKEDGVIKEKVWKVGGMYSPAIEKIVYWLEKAIGVAENEKQKAWLQKLVEYYKTGDLKTWDEYNILWVKDTESMVDVVNGFIEVYGDPLGMKASYESVVSIKDIATTKRAMTVSENAQWFEDNSPVNPKFKKKEVKGVSAKVITTLALGGDCYPTTPIGINLPNSGWIRKMHGSKSVTMDNITYASSQANRGNGLIEEFSYSPEETQLSKNYGYQASCLLVDLHECSGHGSGQILPGVDPNALKNYHSPLEEARADLFALYYLGDKKMVELGLLPSLDVAKAGYNGYIRNGLMVQLARVALGKNIMQAHMRNRQMVASWVYERGLKDNVIEKKIKDGKTYFVINDYEKLRQFFADLLAEVQRIKSEGDYEAGKALVETYGVKVNPDLHKEVKERYEKLHLSPYGGFVNALLTPVMKDGEITDIQVEYQDDFVKQNLYYSKNYSFLPLIN